MQSLVISYLWVPGGSSFFSTFSAKQLEMLDLTVQHKW